MKRFLIHQDGDNVTIPLFVFRRYRWWGLVMSALALFFLIGWMQTRSMQVVHREWQKDIQGLLETNESLLIRNQTSHELLVLASYQLWGVPESAESWEAFKQTMTEFDQLGPENLKDIAKLQSQLKQIQRRY